MEGGLFSTISRVSVSFSRPSFVSFSPPFFSFSLLFRFNACSSVSVLDFRPPTFSSTVFSWLRVRWPLSFHRPSLCVDVPIFFFYSVPPLSCPRSITSFSLNSPSLGLRAGLLSFHRVVALPQAVKPPFFPYFTFPPILLVQIVSVFKRVLYSSGSSPARNDGAFTVFQPPPPFFPQVSARSDSFS